MAMRTRARRCTGKKRNATEQAALAHIARLIERLGAAADAYQAYPCQYCHGWHVGHASPKTRKRQKR